MSRSVSIRNNCARICSLVALAVGGASAVVAAISAALFVTFGPGRESYNYLNSLLGWHGCLTLSVLPFAIVALCLGRRRPALLAFFACLVSWFVTTVLVANTFHGDRPPPNYKSMPGAQPSAAIFHCPAEVSCRPGHSQRSPKKPASTMPPGAREETGTFTSTIA